MKTFKQAVRDLDTSEARAKAQLTGEDVARAVLGGENVREALSLAEGQLRQSLEQRDLSDTGRSSELSYEVTARGVSIYAATHLFVLKNGAKYGSRMPPVDDILAWVQRKGIGGSDPRSVAFAVARSIQKNGLEPHPGLTDDWREAVMEELKERARKDIKQAAKGFLLG